MQFKNKQKLGIVIEHKKEEAYYIDINIYQLTAEDKFEENELKSRITKSPISKSPINITIKYVLFNGVMVYSFTADAKRIQKIISEYFKL